MLPPKVVAPKAPRRLTAVCIAGQLRTFLQPVVQEAFVSQVHHASYEYYVSVNEDRPNVSTTVLRVAPIVAWTRVPRGFRGPLGNAEDNFRDSSKCPPHTCNPGLPLLPIAHRLAACHHSMQREEARRRVPYAFVLRIRPDHLFLAALPHPAALLAGQPAGHILLWDDQIAVARREVATTVLLTPQIVYTTCASATDFERACGSLDPAWSIRRCQKDHTVPCEVMWLITSFGSVSSSVGSLHDQLKMRSWEGAKAGQTYTTRGDFCIKRESFLMDNPENDCRNNGGCMDC